MKYWIHRSAGPWMCKGQETWIVMDDKGILSLQDKNGTIVRQDDNYINIRGLITYSKPVWGLGTLSNIDPELAVDAGL